MGSTTWTLAHIERLHKAGKIKSFKEVNPATAKTKELKKLTRKEPEGLTFIKRMLDDHRIPYCTELQFDKVRKFRFDIALPLLKVALEYEGLAYKKTGHTTSEGYTSNATKYNLAASQGWTVYRYTFKNYRGFEQDLKTILKTENSGR